MAAQHNLQTLVVSWCNFFAIEGASATFLVVEYFQTLPLEINGAYEEPVHPQSVWSARGHSLCIHFGSGLRNRLHLGCAESACLLKAVVSFNLGVSETLLFMRVYALSGSNRYMGAFLAILWTGIFCGLMVNVYQTTKVLEFLEFPFRDHACLAKPVASQLCLGLPFFLILAEQAVVMVLCIYYGLNKHWSAYSRLIRTFSRDGTYYFIAISLMSVANVAFNLTFPGKFQHYFGPPQGVVQSALASRLVLHLRQRANDPPVVDTILLKPLSNGAPAVPHGDRIAGPSFRLHQLPNASHAGLVNEHNAALARRFFGSQARKHAFRPSFSANHAHDLAGLETSGVGPDLQQAWAKEQSMRAIEAFVSSFLPSYVHDLARLETSGAGPNLQAWAKEQSMRALEASGGWTSEFSPPGAANASHAHPQQPMASRPDTQQRSSFMSSYNTYDRSMMNQGMYGGIGTQYGASSHLQILVQDEGKGKIREEDFEAAFAKAASSLSMPDIEHQEDVTAEETKEEASTEGDFKELLNNMQKSERLLPEEDPAKAEAEFSQTLNAQQDEVACGALMEEAWEDGIGGFRESPSSDKVLRLDAEGVPILEDYVFELSNPFMESHSWQLLEEAKALLENNGSLSEAALMIEAAIQKGHLGEGGYEAWILLGETRSMDEREEAGMKALMEGVKRAEAAGNAGEGILSLAISFANESYDLCKRHV
ncbi:hypothetical protein BKA70DRAFT_1435216 [Coprinopsis sp. MPI-PUGE-AT-0042]|nr:hypothetical protein BKA70DRAFT_1435216 [Coprinopsis sp. MPI-PUGE-AT-0042]